MISNRIKVYFTNLSYKNVILLFLVGVIVFFLLVLYIEIKTPEIFMLLGYVSSFLIIYYVFDYISRKVINYENLSGKISKYISNHFHFSLTTKVLRKICNTFKLLLGIVFFYLTINSIRYIFIFTHEASHAIVGIFYGLDITDFKISLNGKSYTKFLYIPYGITASIIIVSGSLGALILGALIILLLMQRKEIKAEIFFPFFWLIVLLMLGEIDYWIASVLSETGDAWDFLQNNPSISGIQLIQSCNMIKYGLLYFLVLLFFIKIGFMLRRWLYKILPDLTPYFI